MAFRLKLMIIVLLNSHTFAAIIGGLVTVAAAGFGLWLKYVLDRKNAALSILQEIRRAEDLTQAYRELQKMPLYKKIIATNSWSKNKHFFVGQLENDEMDRISDLYSECEFLDHIILNIIDHKFYTLIEETKVKALVEATLAEDPSGATPRQVKYEESNAWKGFLDRANKMQLIYHSDIGRKLKEIANKKVMGVF